MDLIHELTGTFSGQLTLVVLFFASVGIPLGIWLALRHVSMSPAEQMDRKAHPEQNR